MNWTDTLSRTRWWFRGR